MSTVTTAPVVLFVYNRPEHARLTLEALAANDLADQSELYIYSDGPKYGALPEDMEKVRAVRKVIRGGRWCRQVHIIESEYNRGLADSIVAGVTEVVNRHGRVIVLEDDIVTRRGFLRFMNEALKLYEDEPRVMQISGMIYGTPRGVDPEGTSFLRVLACHGWATWERAWRHYQHDVDALIRGLERKGISPHEFDIDGAAHFYKQLLRNREGDLYTWAVRWYASWLVAGGYALFPHRSLVTNIGHDGTGVHGPASFYNGETIEYLTCRRQPVEENRNLRAELGRIWREGRGLDKRLSRRVSLARRLRRSLARSAARAIRTLVSWAYPELAHLDGTVAKHAGILSSSYKSIVSPRARLYQPYHLHDVVVGDYTYIRPNAWISMASIGKFCSIGPWFRCGGGIHPIEGISTSPMFYSTRRPNGVSLSGTDKVVERKRVTIGNDVFIGMNVTILDGVTIGDGAVVGAGTVVSKDVPPFAVVVGNPMRILRFRFSEDVRRALMEIRWWEWPEERLQEIEKYLFAVDEFIGRFTEGTAGVDSETCEGAQNSD